MFRPAIRLDDLWSGEMTSVLVAGRRVLLVNVDGDVAAFEDRCLHKGVPLSNGTLAGRILTCSAHEWAYDVTTGCGINPASICLRRFPVLVADGVIQVDVEERL